MNKEVGWAAQGGRHRIPKAVHQAVSVSLAFASDFGESTLFHPCKVDSPGPKYTHPPRWKEGLSCFPLLSQICDYSFHRHLLSPCCARPGDVKMNVIGLVGGHELRVPVVWPLVSFFNLSRFWPYLCKNEENIPSPKGGCHWGSRGYHHMQSPQCKDWHIRDAQ